MNSAVAHYCNWCNQPMAQLDKAMVCNTCDAVTARAACGCSRIRGPGPREVDTPCLTHAAIPEK